MKFIKQGDIFKSSCGVIANPINCVGVMGAGLALATSVLSELDNKIEIDIYELYF